MQDLAMHLLDIVYNSIAAKASLIKITLINSVQKDRLSLKIEDNGCGMDEQTVEKVQSPFYTSRTTRDVGLGIPLFKSTALSCDGNFSLSSKEHVGTVIEANIKKSHWDCPPLGDIANTLCVLIQADISIDYVFVYEDDDHTFEFDTKMIKETLEDVPLNHPDILNWLEGYIKEGMNL